MEPICWLKITDYMRGWARRALGGTKRVRNNTVIEVQHIAGVQAVLEMPADDELHPDVVPGNVICDTWHAALEVGLEMDAESVEKLFCVTRELFCQYPPVSCPPYAMYEDGTIHPWDSDTSFGQQQAASLLRLIREAFWQAVGVFSNTYQQAHKGERYAQVEMIEAFCKEYRTDDMYVEAMRREWQRRQKRCRERVEGE